LDAKQVFNTEFQATDHDVHKTIVFLTNAGDAIPSPVAPLNDLDLGLVGVLLGFRASNGRRHRFLLLRKYGCVSIEEGKCTGCAYPIVVGGSQEERM
jgi:hypothetical protein